MRARPFRFPEFPAPVARNRGRDQDARLIEASAGTRLP
jgi:hypothetical protein